jgi:hypothetical protein
MPHRWNDHEHRWGERFRVNVTVNVAATTLAKVSGRLRNISLSGALIRADVNLPLNSLIEVSFMPPPTRIGVVLNAHITRKLEEDVGIEWCEFAPNAVKDLLRSTRAQL